MIPWARPDFDGYEEKYVKQALKSSWVSDGPFVKKFESNFSTYLNVKNSITVSNGTAAIHLIYLAMGLKKGDEVIVPGFGYMAAANIAIQMGLKPVFADVDLETFCVTAKNIEKKITLKAQKILKDNNISINQIKSKNNTVKAEDVIAYLNNLKLDKNNKKQNIIVGSGAHSCLIADVLIEEKKNY